MKKKLTWMLASAALAATVVLPTESEVTLAATAAQAEEITRNPGVKIDREHFPCDLIREDAARLHDKDRDGFLSEEEIEAVTFWGVNALDEWVEWKESLQPGALSDPKKLKEARLTKEEEYKRYGIVDCRGLEIFKNLRGVSLTMTSVGSSGNRLKNLSCLGRLKKLEYLTIENSHSVRHYDLSKFKKLRELSLINCSEVQKVTFRKKSKIKKIDLSGTDGNGNIDVSGLRRLKKFKADFTRLRKITFGKKNRSLKKIYIGGDPSVPNKKIKSLDFSKVKNLKNLEVNFLDGLEKIKLGKRKIKNLNIYRCKKLGV